MEKECKDCHRFLDISLFPSFIRDNGKVYILNQCLECNKAYKRKHYQENKEQYRSNNQNYIIDNEEEVDAYRKQYRLDNKDKISEYQKEYYQDNKTELDIYSKEYVKERSKRDPIFKLRKNISKLVASYLKRQGHRKSGISILDKIGYTIEQLKNYLESQFEPWMTWDNWGPYNSKTWDDNDLSTWTWQIDHIIPQTALPYTSMEDDNFKKCWALENLRPLSAKQNLIKGNRLC